MAKAKQNDVPEVETPEQEMSKEDAQAIVDKYEGINGVYVPAELKKAREVLKGE